jgi:type VI secretion system protein ImpJ
MFLRPHHLQGGQRWTETIIRTGLDATRPFSWGFLELEVAPEPLENFTLRLDRCIVRMKDGTWVRIPENTEVPPLEFSDALDAGGGSVEILLGIPQMQEVRANSISLEEPTAGNGTPRYEPMPISRRDENTGENPQTVYVRRMCGRLFVAGDDTTGYDVVRVGRVKRSDRPGAVPELDDLGAGPMFALQADPGLSGIITSLADQIEAKDEVLAREAREHRMLFTDGVAANTEHLLKLHALNESRAHLRALLQCPVLHPYDVFVMLCRLIGHLSVFAEELVPGAMPNYDHDHPGKCFEEQRKRITRLLDAMRPLNFAVRPFTRKKDDTGQDGLEVELDRKWIDDNLEVFLALESTEMEINELKRHVGNTFNLKLASPRRAPRILTLAVRGLGFDIRAVPAGILPRRQELHYFKIDKTIGADRTDYWKECEQERGIRMSMRAEQLAAMEKFKPALYVVTEK